MKTFMTGLVAGASALLLASPVHAQGADRGWWMMSGWGWDQMPFGGIMMIVVWVGIILILAMVARGFAAGGRPAGQTPAEILDERYAKGEIDQKEYDERRRTLSGRL